MKLEFVGDEKMTRYTGDEIDCRQGDIVDVSQDKYDQLLKDFPKWWKVIGRKKRGASTQIIDDPVKQPLPVEPDFSDTEILDKELTWSQIKAIAKKNNIKTFGRKRIELEAELRAKKLI